MATYTVYFIKTQVASGDNNTHKYQTVFVVDGNVIEPALSEALDTSGEALYIDRFGQLVKEDRRENPPIPKGSERRQRMKLVPIPPHLDSEKFSPKRL